MAFPLTGLLWGFKLFTRIIYGWKPQWFTYILEIYFHFLIHRIAKDPKILSQWCFANSKSWHRRVWWVGKVSVNLSWNFLCQKPETCTDSHCLFPKLQTLFTKAIHHYLKQPELYPPSPSPHTKLGPWFPSRVKFLDNSSLFLDVHLGLLREFLGRHWDREFQSEIIVPSGPICLPSEILSRKAGQGEQRAGIVGKCPKNEALNGRWGLLSKVALLKSLGNGE